MISVKKSFFWSGVEQLGPQAVRFVLFVTLARLLEPSDFGLVAMLTVFMALANVFVDAGFSAALVQRKTLSLDDETSIFALNVFAGCVLAALLCLISPLAADFYQKPILVPLLCVSALTIVIASFGMVQSALLSRRMLFQKSAFVATASTVVSGITGIVMASLGFGVWSLLGVSISESLVRTALYWKMTKWSPRGSVRLKNIRSMWGFSSRLLVCNFIGVVYQNSYAVIIGKTYSSASLGYFNRANHLRMLPANVLAGIVSKVSFPLFSRQQDDKALLLKQMREIIRSTLLLSAGGMTLLAVVADPLIPLLMTEKWRPIIPLLRILCFASVTYPVHALYLMTLQAQGLSHLNLRLESIKAVIGLILIGLVYRYGVTALALTMLAMAVIAYFVNAWYNVKILGYRWRMQAFDILPSFFLCGIAGYIAWCLGTIAQDAPVIVLGVQVCSFLMLCGFGVFVLRRVYFRDVWGHLVWAFDQMKS